MGNAQVSQFLRARRRRRRRLSHLAHHKVSRFHETGKELPSLPPSSLALSSRWKRFVRSPSADAWYTCRYMVRARRILYTLRTRRKKAMDAGSCAMQTRALNEHHHHSRGMSCQADLFDVLKDLSVLSWKGKNLYLIFRLKSCDKCQRSLVFAKQSIVIKWNWLILLNIICITTNQYNVIR